MNILKASLIVVVSAASFHANAQTADDIVNKYVAAIGGKDVIAKVKTMILQSDVNVMGQSFPSTTTMVVNQGYKNVTTVNGSEIIQCFTPDGGWQLNPMMGATSPTPVSDDEKKLGAYRYDVGGALVNYKEKGSTVELAGTDSVNGVKAIKLKVKDKNGFETMTYLDPNTYYILKQETKGTVNGQEFSVTTTFSDYRKTDIGFVLPFTMNTSTQGFDVTITHNKVEFNKEVDPKIFEMPKS
jgi:outer membrane lipoprotein-sorting protein